MGCQKAVYDFCPVCGGLMKNDICMSCGYLKEESATGKPDSQKHTGFLPGMGGVVGIFILVFVLALSMIARDIRSDAFARGKKPPEINGQDFFSQLESLEEGDDGTFQLEGLPALPDIPGLKEKLEEIQEGQKKVEEAMEQDSQLHLMEGGKVSSYVPQPTDEYYEEIVDSLRKDLSYQIEWKTYERETQDGSASCYAVYPQLIGELPRREQLNAWVEAQALSCGELLAQDGCPELHAESVSYVTYMDENVVSIVMRDMRKTDGLSVQRLHDINIDLAAGTVFKHEDMLQYSAELAEEFRSRNSSQNGSKMSGEVWTTRLLTEQLSGENGILFFTPVGLEIGINYSMDISGESGWATVTLKEYEKYLEEDGSK